MLHVWKHSTMWGRLANELIPSNTKKFYVDFALIFWKAEKNCYVPSFFGCLVSCQRNSWPKTHPTSTVSRIKTRKILYGRHFLHTRCFLHYLKVRFPKYCGKRAFQDPEKSWDMSASLSVGAILCSSMTSLYVQFWLLNLHHRFCSWMSNIHERSRDSNSTRSLTHSILINLFIKVGLNIFSPASPAKYCFCPRVFNGL